MAAVGNAIHAARKAGRCCHQSAQGYRGGPRSAQQEGLTPGQLRCTDGGGFGCGAIFASDDDWADAMEEAIFA